MATLTRQLKLTNRAMALMVRAATDSELLALAGSVAFDLSDLTDHELIQIVAGLASAATAAKIRPPELPRRGDARPAPA